MIDLISDAIGSPKVSDMLGNKEQFEKAQKLRNLVSSDQSDKEAENQNYIDKNISYLRNYWYEKYPEQVGDKDGSEDRFENWMENEGQDELKRIIDECVAYENASQGE